MQESTKKVSPQKASSLPKPLSSVHRIVLVALLSSVVLLSTMFLKLQTPTGYIHLGDGVIYGAALAFGPSFAAISGGLGSSMADVLGGYAIWAPWTFAIKAVAGYIIGKLSGKEQKEGTRTGEIIAMAAGAVWTIAAYALATSILYSPAAALGESLGNVIQTSSGIAIGYFLGPILKAAVRNNGAK